MQNSMWPENPLPGSRPPCCQASVPGWLWAGGSSSPICGLPHRAAWVFAQPSAGNLQSIRAEGTSPRDSKGGRSCSAINSWLQRAYAVTPAVLTQSHRSAHFYVGVRGHEYQGVRIIGGQRWVQLSKLLTQWVIIAHSMSLQQIGRAHV